MSNIVVAAIGLLGILVGASVQAWLGSRSERGRFVRDQKLAAYRDLVSGIADLSIYLPAEEKAQSARALVADARLRVAIFGSSNVVESLGLVFEKFQDFSGDEAKRAMSNAVQAMRADLHHGNAISSPTDLSRLVFSSYRDVGI